MRSRYRLAAYRGHDGDLVVLAAVSSSRPVTEHMGTAPNAGWTAKSSRHLVQCDDDSAGAAYDIGWKGHLERVGDGRAGQADRSGPQHRSSRREGHRNRPGPRVQRILVGARKRLESDVVDCRACGRQAALSDARGAETKRCGRRGETSPRSCRLLRRQTACRSAACSITVCRPLPTGYNNNYQIVQTPEYVAIRYEMLTEVRLIPLDGRPHVGSGIRQWMGNSRGHWEGGRWLSRPPTTTSRSRSGSPRPTRPRVVERFTRVERDHDRLPVHD